MMSRMRVKELKKICVVGAGTMGYQIALQCAFNGYHVAIFDISKEALKKAQEHVEKTLQDRVVRKLTSEAHVRESLSRITCYDQLEKAARSADFVIEAVYESVDVKRQVFSQLSKICSPHTILASNTSSIRSSLFADATSRPEKVLAMNFGNPVWEHTTVEIMGNPKTSKETINLSARLALSIGITPIVINKEIAGYAFNRVWRAVKKESLHLVDGGYVSFEDIDRAFMINLGTSMGPFMLMDMIGLDVVLAIERQYYSESGDESDKPPGMLDDMVKKGQLGVKSGKGFYSYPNPSYKQDGWIRGKPE